MSVFNELRDDFAVENYPIPRCVGANLSSTREAIMIAEECQKAFKKGWDLACKMHEPNPHLAMIPREEE
jgi:hypothetical protein